MAELSTIPDLTPDEYKELATRLPSVNPTTGLPRGTSPAVVTAINRNAAHPTASAFMPRVAEAPDVATPTGEPALAPTAIPSVAAPTKQQAHAAGRREYAEGLPRVTAAPFTPEYFQQEQQLADFKSAHPLGSDISARPGLLGKIEHGLAKAGNIAGDAVIPNVMRNIPGTDLNLAAKTAGREAGFNQAEEAQQRAAQTGQVQAMTAATVAGNEPVEWTPPGQATPITVPEKSVPTLEAAAVKAGEAGTAAQTKNAPALAKLGLKYDADNNVVPMDEHELSPELKQARTFQDAATDLKKAQTALANSKNDPNSASYKLEKAKVDEARERTQQAAQAMGLHQQQEANKEREQGLVKPSGQTTSRGDAAGAALELLPELQDAIRNNAASLGPIMGRIAKGEIALGNVDPEVQKLYSTMKSFYSLQPAIHGFRNAEFVKDFDSFVGSLQTNPEAVIAGLEGLKPTLQAVEKSGRTYKPRIIQGAGEGAAAPAAAPGGTAPTHRYNPDTRKIEVVP